MGFIIILFTLFSDLNRSTGCLPTVDRVRVRLDRSTGPVDRSPGRCTYQCACLPVDRVGRPSWSFCSLYFSVDRGGRPI